MCGVRDSCRRLRFNTVRFKVRVSSQQVNYGSGQDSGPVNDSGSGHTQSK
ncbi:hypothetical protein Hanom_Chr15g01407231 [Helianthus anomalus]